MDILLWEAKEEIAPVLNLKHIWDNSSKEVTHSAFWARVKQLGWTIEEALQKKKYDHAKIDKRTLQRLSKQNKNLTPYKY